MATLILLANSASAITVTCQRAGKSAPRNVGGVTPSYNGALRSTVRGQAKVIPILASYVDTATEATIQAAVMNGVQIACSGDILQNIQTQCSFENVVSNMIPGLPGFFEMAFTLNEVQASVTLLRYAPGDVVTGEAFTRSTIAYQINSSGVPVSIAINTKRDGHYIGGVRSLLLEDASTNGILWASDFSNIAWAKASATVATGVVDPAGGTGACTLTATGANGQASQALATGASISRTNSAWLRRRTGTGTVLMLQADGSAFQAVAVTSTWTRFNITSAASIQRQHGIRLATSGDAVDIFIAQQDDHAFATSEINTTTVAVTRGADSYSLPFTTPPQEMTVYVKFVEKGTIVGAQGRVFAIINAVGSAGPQFIIYQAGGTGYRAYYDDTVNAAISVLATNPAVGDGDELVAHLFADGSVDILQSINSAASTSAAQSSAVPLPTAFSGQLFWLNSAGSAANTTGFIAIQSLKVVAGARSLAEMRAA